MLWMETFCFYCSVRLGVIVSAILSTIEVLIPLILFFVYNSKALSYIVEIVGNDEEYRENEIIENLQKTLSEKPEIFFGIIESILIFYILTCFLAMYGALKLSKWFLIPYGINEFCRFILLLTTHIIAMIILKKQLNLGVLIATTIAGGFILLFVAYRWAAVVAMFQIINLVKSEKYKALYGDDPFVDWDSQSNQFNTRKTTTDPLIQSENTETTKAWTNVTKKKFTGVATIRLDEPDIKLAVKEFQNWHISEMMRPKQSNLMRFY